MDGGEVKKKKKQLLKNVAAVDKGITTKSLIYELKTDTGVYRHSVNYEKC